jgi:deoxyribonuclease-4
MELEFVHGVRINRAGAISIREKAEQLNIKLTAHCPYYINFNSRDYHKVHDSRERIVQSARMAFLCGASSIAFHPAFYMGDSSEKVLQVVRNNLKQILEKLGEDGIDVWVRPEMTGKISSFGTIDEVLELSAELPNIAPCIDFAHLHARYGGFNSYYEFSGLLKKVAQKLGQKSLEQMHIHVSGIAYGDKGETKHINLEESDFNYHELMQALADYHCSGLVICESPNLERDALLLQEIYRKF